MADRNRRARFGAALMGVALVAVGCGGGGESSSTTRARETGGAAPTTVAGGEAQAGGTVTYGLEAETDGWNPTANRFAISGTEVAMAIFDPLAIFDENGEASPYLAESIEPNDEYTEWTITLRPDITFHNGDPLTSEAVKRSLEAHTKSILTAPAVRPIDHVEIVDDLSAKVVMREPWVAFPAMLTAQVGIVPAPAQLDDKENSATEPIGTGPFVFDRWQRQVELVTTRNDDYWRTDAAGQQLPYLDGITFTIIENNLSRMNGLLGGEVDIMHTTSFSEIKLLRKHAKDGKVQVIENAQEGEESFVLLNTTSPPLDDVRVRKALALATDQERYIEITAEGIPAAATGPFTKASPWFAESGYPTYDLPAAKALVDEIEADKGPISFTLGTTPSPANQRSIELLIAMWAEAGIEAKPKFTEQAAFIGDALGGAYQANLWRLFGALDPDADYYWWSSENTGEKGLALNFARLADDEVDAAINDGRRGATETDRKEAYERLQRRFAELVPYIWLHHTIWTIAARPEVHGIVGHLPDNTTEVPVGGNFSGIHLLAEIWIEH